MGQRKPTEKERKAIDKGLANLDSDRMVLFTHGGFNNSGGLNDTEKERLHFLAKDMVEHNFCIRAGRKCLAPYNTSYDGGTVMAGLQVLNIKVMN